MNNQNFAIRHLLSIVGLLLLCVAGAKAQNNQVYNHSRFSFDLHYMRAMTPNDYVRLETYQPNSIQFGQQQGIVPLQVPVQQTAISVPLNTMNLRAQFNLLSLTNFDLKLTAGGRIGGSARGVATDKSLAFDLGFGGVLKTADNVHGLDLMVYTSPVSVQSSTLYRGAAIQSLNFYHHEDVTKPFAPSYMALMKTNNFSVWGLNLLYKPRFGKGIYGTIGLNYQLEFAGQASLYASGEVSPDRGFPLDQAYAYMSLDRAQQLGIIKSYDRSAKHNLFFVLGLSFALESGE